MRVVLDHLEKKYGESYAVKSICLEIKDGALHFLLGPSGCGKTTTLRMLAGLEKPTGGKIFFDDKEVTHMPAAERGIGMVFQNYALWPHMTVRKNIEYGLKLKKLSSSEIKSRLADVVEITQLQGYEERLPGQLSGGQQQRVALARALAVRPHVLLLDEPLSNLDAKLRLEMRDNISRIHKQTGITTVYVTHDQKEALSMGTSVTVMRKGELIQTDAPRKLYYHPGSAFIASFIGETNLITGQVVGAGQGIVSVDTCFGRMQAVPTQDTIKVNDQVLLSIRPESFKVHFSASSLANAGEDNKLALTVSHLTYLGESEQFQLRFGSEKQLLKATVFHAPEHQISDGDQVDVSVATCDVLALPFENVIGGT